MQDMSIRKFIVVLSASVGLAAMASPAQAGTKDDVRDLQSRMATIEQALSAQSAATVRISQLEREIQELTGQIEELQYKLDQSNRRLDSVSAVLAGDPSAAAMAGGDPAFGGPALPSSGPVDLTSGDPIADRIGESTPDGGDAPVSSQAAPSTDVGANDIALPLDSSAAFDYASKFLLEGDYQKAKAAFQLYVKAFPNSPRTADAQFRLGEIHLALGENADAADVFINHVRKYPNDPRAAEAYLKLGTSFARLDKPQEACTVFKTMKSKFPNAPSAVMQRADIEMARIDCQ